jgi:hypothetical protein
MCTMKHDIMISARVTPWMKELIEELAGHDERTLSWTVRKLLIEALDARGLVGDQQQKKDLNLRSDKSPRRKAVAGHHTLSEN